MEVVVSFSRNQIQRLLNHADIEKIIKTYIPLKQRPKNPNEYKTLCPFHNEKSPSFTVTTKKQFYHCFGCGTHGNAIRFVMEYQGLNYVNAIKKVAEISRFKLPSGTNPSRKKISDRKKRREKLHREWLKEYRAKYGIKIVDKKIAKKSETVSEFVIDDDIPW